MRAFIEPSRLGLHLKQWPSAPRHNTAATVLVLSSARCVAVHMSTYDFLGWPEEVSVILVSLTAVLALVPWFGGKELGPLTVPTLDPVPTQWLRHWGWAGPVLALALYFPVWPSRASGASPTSFDVEVRFHSS